ncbi:MAG TPA: STAS domain-containing protein [Gaiellales bacterium]|jgi:anti-anti-sigma factor|nr:STAS domain-containing protein [Gaiellales bacterium]
MDGTFRIEDTGGIRVIALRGEHDLTTEPSLHDGIETALATGSSVIVDLSEAEFIDSTVIAAIIHGQRLATERHADDVAVVAAAGARSVARLLSLVGVEEVVPVYLTRAAAVEGVRRRRPDRRSVGRT